MSLKRRSKLFKSSKQIHVRQNCVLEKLCATTILEHKRRQFSSFLRVRKASLNWSGNN